ncbi:hypothetical protein COK00_03725 [Bacillus cereus]|uniref:Imm33-like domain-containing protein n=1 Tax=Bacillus cereus TaxID=1396 RepID=A0A2B2T2G2_BACCE|nr:DUF2185 domain-containing protein [Bacillus cereus]PEC84647.1 hypothetical protein CON28_14295 [Bacillus cereus]PEQ49027.1 hypothetical protein CN468_13170 [Bacillus cereus]PEX39615.1 hypothetical protein CN455_06395 [Bacillus cereus]PFB18826.1 hypothetical protein CN399_03105 [Bacillus cereus]PFC71833.1 hypothetical protein CN290_21155 [Bacillus cereus]
MKTIVKNIGGKNIIATAEEHLSPQIEKLLYLLTKVEDNKLVDGFSIQVGWSIFILSKCEDGYRIIVPDYTKNPFKDTTEDLTIALWVQLEQVHCLRQLNIDGEMIKFSDKIVTAKNVLQLDEVYLQRASDFEKGDSGWYIGPVDETEETEETEDELEAFYAYQLLKIRPSIIQVLALPYEYLVVFEKDKIKAILDDNDVDVWNGVTN